MVSTGKFRSTLAAVLACAGIGTAHAIPIVDTGTPTETNPADPAYSLYGADAESFQFLAGRFTTTEAYSITGLSAFVRDYACCGLLANNFSLALATGPDTLFDSELTNLFEAQTSFDSSNGATGWATAAVDNYLLDAGTYWIVAFVPTEQFGHSGLAMPWGAPDPLDASAFSSGGNGGWRNLASYQEQSIGFRVDGDRVPVSEPGTLALMLAGFLGVLTLARRRLI